jgi:hypothetical protein
MKLALSRESLEKLQTKLKGVEAASDRQSLETAHLTAKVLYENASYQSYNRYWVNVSNMGYLYDLYVGVHRLLKTDLMQTEKENAQDIVTYVSNYLKKSVAKYRPEDLDFWPADLLKTKSKVQCYTADETRAIAALLVDAQENSAWLKTATKAQRAYLSYLGKETNAPQTLIAYRQQHLAA